VSDIGAARYTTRRADLKEPIWSALFDRLQFGVARCRVKPSGFWHETWPPGAHPASLDRRRKTP
jgi:hypothetical protein